MKIYKLNRILHRDLGYFFIGMTLIYAISGIAVNHRKDWNPNYSIKNEEFNLGYNFNQNKVNQQQIEQITITAGEEGNYKNHYYPNDSTLRIFVHGGSISVNLKSGKSSLETIKPRPILKEVNFLHYNPGKLWTWFSDFYCVSLTFLAISGLFIIKGKNGLKWRGTILTAIGIIIPLIFLFMYI